MRGFLPIGSVIIAAALNTAAVLWADETGSPTTALGALIAITTMVVGYMGWVIKRQFDQAEKKAAQIEAILISMQKLTSAVESNQATLLQQGTTQAKQTDTIATLHGILQVTLDEMSLQRRPERGHRAARQQGTP